MRRASLKFFFFGNYWWILLLIIGASALMTWFYAKSIAFVLTVLGTGLPVLYFVQKQKLEEMQLFRVAFKEFNERYAALNDQLASIAGMSVEQVGVLERQVLVDYFNLCGEEYLYYKFGYIPPVVWDSWYRGMTALLASPSIKAVWDEESQTLSYYGLSM